MIADLQAGISGKDNRKLFMEIYDRFFAGAPPTEAWKDNAAFAFTRETALEGYKEDLFLSWKGYGYLNIKRDAIVLFGLSAFEIDPKKMLSILENLSFELASFGPLYVEWMDPFNGYLSPSFSNFHVSHGWACAFKGDGFDRLVSRRWLDFGPWKQYPGAHDTQLIQFHQLIPDANKALEQARPGHQLMGITDEGGFIQSDYVYKYDNKGLYSAEEKVLKVIVHGVDIPNRQLLDACAARLYQALGMTMPLENVAYIFMEEKKATEHLHPIWLRGLECRTIRGGKEIRLDTTYHPDPVKPDWVNE